MTGLLVFGMNQLQSKCSIDIFLIKRGERGKGREEGEEEREEEARSKRLIQLMGQ